MDGRRVKTTAEGQRKRSLHTWRSCITVKEENTAQVSNENQATIIDHVINHSLSFREAGQRVQPILTRSTVASITRHFSK